MTGYFKNLNNNSMAIVLVGLGVFAISFVASNGAEIPSPVLMADQRFISPDSDGIQDQVTFRVDDLQFMDGDLTDWQLVVERTTNPPQQVRVIRADHRWIRPARSIFNLFLPAENSIAPVHLPEKIVWDGRDERGLPVSDGEYRITLKIATGKNGDKVLPATIVQVNREKTRLELTPLHTVVVRKTGNREIEHGREIAIVRRSSRDEGFLFENEIYDQPGKQVYLSREKGKLNEPFTWQGVDNMGNPVLPGQYRYRLIARSPSGEVSIVENNHLSVLTEENHLALISDHLFFSPDGNGINDSVHFRIAPVPEQARYYQNWNDRLNVTRWQFTIRNSAGATVYEQKGIERFPETVEWDGRNQEGIASPEGDYLVSVELESSHGKLKPPPIHVGLDHTVPEVELELSRVKFTPDGDGENDCVSIKPYADDVSGITHWSIEILLNPRPEFFQPPVFRKYEGDWQPDGVLVWCGEGEQGERAESLEHFQILLKAEDGAGNSVKKPIGELQTGMVFRPVTSGGKQLIVQIPDQGYFIKDSQLTSQGKNALEELTGGLARYGRYHMILEYHLPDLGKDRDSLKKSENRARSAMDYLREKGVDPLRWTARGMGESESLIKGTSDLANYRNRRFQVRMMPQEGMDSNR